MLSRTALEKSYAGEELCMGAESTIYHWHKHFGTILSICSNFEVNTIHYTWQCPVTKELTQLLVEDEVLEALCKFTGTKLEETLVYC